MKEKQNLPYRQGVQAYIFNEKNEFIIMCGKGDETFWKIPSGGIDKGESPTQALRREMKEEFNIDLEILKMLETKNKFDWPDEIIKKNKYKYAGQEQIIFITKIKPNQKINPCQKEIHSYKWINIKNANKYLKLKQQQTKLKETYNIYLKKNENKDIL